MKVREVFFFAGERSYCFAADFKNEVKDAPKDCIKIFGGSAGDIFDGDCFPVLGNDFHSYHVADAFLDSAGDGRAIVGDLDFVCSGKVGCGNKAFVECWDAAQVDGNCPLRVSGFCIDEECLVLGCKVNFVSCAKLVCPDPRGGKAEGECAFSLSDDFAAHKEKAQEHYLSFA